MAEDTFILEAGRLTLPALQRFWRAPGKIALAPACYAAMERSAETVAAVVAEGRTMAA